MPIYPGPLPHRIKLPSSKPSTIAVPNLQNLPGCAPISSEDQRKLEENMRIGMEALEFVRSLNIQRTNFFLGRPDDKRLGQEMLMFFPNLRIRALNMLISAVGDWLDDADLAENPYAALNETRRMVPMPLMPGRLVGNCGEMAATTFLYLFDKGHRNIHMVSKKEGDHAFVVIGPHSVHGDWRQWPEHAVVCDTWDDKCFPALYMDLEMIGGGNWTASNELGGTMSGILAVEKNARRQQAKQRMAPKSNFHGDAPPEF